VILAVISGGCATLTACSGRSSSASRGDGAVDAASAAEARAEATVIAPPALPLGKAAIAEFGYRRGPGRADYERAVKVEKSARDDSAWHDVVAACRAALERDPGHLDAAWLLAAALARLGAHDQIVAPLSTAVAGDWGKWGERSLTLPLFERFLESPHGDVWRQLAEHYRSAFGEATRGAVVVLGREDEERRTELYAWDRSAGRWLRLTRTGGTVVAALPGPAGSGLVAYVAYRELGQRGDRRGAVKRPRIAVVELDGGRVSRELPFADVDELRLGWRAGKPNEDPGLTVKISGGKDAGVWALDWKRGTKKKAGKKVTVGKDALVVARGQVRRLRLPVQKITADWDDDGLASAIRLDATRRTVEPPAGLAIDGHGLVWSPDRSRLAMIAVSEDDCAAPAILFVADAGTGTLREIGRAVAPAPAWVTPTELAYTDGDHVKIIDVTTARTVHELSARGGVATEVVDRACASRDDEAVFAPATVGDDLEIEDEPILDVENAPPPEAGGAAAGTAG
jgi:hypothetical protein